MSVSSAPGPAGSLPLLPPGTGTSGGAAGGQRAGQCLRLPLRGLGQCQKDAGEQAHS